MADRKARKNKPVRKRDGSTPAKAIVEDQSVWRRRNCPGFTLALQRLTEIDGKYFDVLTLRSEDETRIVYFALTHLGKQRGR